MIEAIALIVAGSVMLAVLVDLLLGPRIDEDERKATRRGYWD